MEAVSLPRWVIGAQSDGDTLRTATAEADVPEAASRALGASFDLRTVAPRHESLGHSNVIEVTRHSDRPAFRAASDPRADGSALIV
ncbi:hypothetical protein [Nesterenkonia pannonica]|uniref:hypothetical protein n=1 Tax=Nesterenkonia pannonica TaxID=1548602 RepID=UPI0021644804|nr:hypothetical protein [Nesterenkonia pannonica]